MRIEKLTTKFQEALAQGQSLAVQADNQFIEPSIVRELIEAGKRNENFRRVFVEGEIGQIEGTVFDNWSEG